MSCLLQSGLAVVSVFLWLCVAGSVQALSVLTWNSGGNGAVDWSTNSAQIQAIGRQVQYLNPDVITFQEIPFSQTGQMTNFVRSFLPGYFLATNSGTDGAIRSVILSRYPILRSQKWLDGVSLTNFGYNGIFTRDLFEAEIAVTNFSRPLHVFTTHLKASGDTNSLARRAAEASAISNFFVTSFLPQYGQRPYLLTGDLNEDISRPPAGSQGPVQRLVSAPTGLRLTTPRNPFNGDERTWSIRNSSLTIRFDYILPGGLLFSNQTGSQVFRTDLLNPRPPPLLVSDSATASDHLPVLMTFNNPFDLPFAVSLIKTNGSIRLNWMADAGRIFRVESSTNFVQWMPVASNVVSGANGVSLTITNQRPFEFFRVYRTP